MLISLYGLNFISIVRIVVTIVIFVILSIFDIKTREIDPKLWIFIIPIFAFLSVMDIEFNSISISIIKQYVIGIIVDSIIAFAFYFFGLFGGADMFALIALSIAVPIVGFVIIYQLLLIVYSGIIGLLIILLFLLLNIAKKNWEKLPSNIGVFKKIALMSMAIPVPIKELDRYKFFYPLTIYNCKDNQKHVIIRLSFDIEEDYSQHIREIKKLLEIGCINDNEYIWITYGIPFLVNLTISYILVVFGLNIFAPLMVLR